MAFRAVCWMSLLFFVVNASNAQPTYPTRAVTIVVPFTPATGADVIARLLQSPSV